MGEYVVVLLRALQAAAAAAFLQRQGGGADPGQSEVQGTALELVSGCRQPSGVAVASSHIRARTNRAAFVAASRYGVAASRPVRPSA